MSKKTFCFQPAEILLPDFDRVDGTRWSVIACDQYTSEPDYWSSVGKLIGPAPSTLRLMLPEIYLNERETRIPGIHDAMREALSSGLLVAHPSSMIYLERTQSDGRVRRGVIGAIDLENYDYTPDSLALIRATERTVLERIPPRMEIRRGAALETPHVMLLIDDPDRTVIEPLAGRSGTPIYDFDLMKNGGHVRGYELDRAEQSLLTDRLAALITPEAICRRYDVPLAPMLFAVGDGNHSLASAKACYEELKEQLGKKALTHPARYALCEVVNIHDPALDFEPIYRVLFNVRDPRAVIDAMKDYAGSLYDRIPEQRFTVLTAQEETEVVVPYPERQLTTATLQYFLDVYTERHPEVRLDYIHGEKNVRALVAGHPDRVGFLFSGMTKSDLFRTVLYDGSLPRKTFSMGNADDKRFYLECRRLTEL